MTTKTMSEADAVREATAILRALELRLHGDPVAASLGRIAKRLEEIDAQLAADFVIVPREPTEAMHDAARDWSLKKYGRGVGREGSDGCYRAMLDAAEKKPDAV